MASTSLSGPLKPSTEMSFPIRPAFATAGAKVTVWANYFPLQVKPPVFWKYHLDLLEKSQSGSTKEVKGRKLQLVIQKLIDQLGSKQTAIASEYKSVLVTVEKLSLSENPVRVELPREGGEGNDVFAVTLNGPTEASMSELANYLSTQYSANNDSPKFPECVDALNIIMGFTPRSRDNISAIGSARFFPFAKDGRNNPLSFEADLWQADRRPLIAARGFFQSTRIATGRLLLNANVTCGVFKLAGPLPEIFIRLGLDNLNFADPNLNTKGLREVAKFLPKTRVQVKMIVGDGKKSKEVWRNKAIFNLAMKSKLSRVQGAHPPVANVARDYAGPYEVSFWKEDENRYCTVAEHFKKSKSLVSDYRRVLTVEPRVQQGAQKGFPPVRSWHCAKTKLFPC